MSQSISLADLTVANDGPVDRVEYTRRSVIAAKSVQEFTEQTAGPALESLIAMATEPSRHEPEAIDLTAVKALAEQVSEQAETLSAEVSRFTAMADKT